jgi:hypothetical protein
VDRHTGGTWHSVLRVWILTSGHCHGGACIYTSCTAPSLLQPLYGAYQVHCCASQVAC